MDLRPRRTGEKTLAAAAATVAAVVLAPGALASHGRTARISVDPLGAIGDDASTYSDMTPDGRFVASCSRTTAVPGPTCPSPWVTRPAR